MWIDELATHVRQGNIPDVGVNVFIFALREDEVGCMLTTHTAGVILDPQIPDYYKGQLQVVVRSNLMQSALDQCQAVSDYLSSYVRRKAGLAIEFDLATTHWNYLYPRNFPVVFARSDGDFYEASVNFDICFVAIFG